MADLIENVTDEQAVTLVIDRLTAALETARPDAEVEEAQELVSILQEQREEMGAGSMFALRAMLGLAP